MKKIYVLVGAALISVSSFAQSSKAGKAVLVARKNIPYVSPVERMNNPDTTGIVNFTDFLPEFNTSSQASFYGYQGGGYIFGNNVTGDTLAACAQGYQNVNPTPVRIIGALMWFGGKSSTNGPSGGTNSKVTVKAWNMSANKAYNDDGNGNPVKNSMGPSTSLNAPIASATITYADIDTSDFNAVSFTTPPAVSGDFAVGVDFSGLAAGDTAGLVCDADGSAGNIDLAFHNLFLGNTWYVTDYIFDGLDVDIAIWAILADATGVKEYFNGMKLTNYPNPATENTTIEYSLEKSSEDVTLVVFDKAGRQIVNQNYNSQAAGTYKVNVSTANLAAGTYYYQLNANGRNFTKQLVVIK